MSEYIDNGATLGWLVDPIDKRVYVFRPGEPLQCLEHGVRPEAEGRAPRLLTPPPESMALATMEQPAAIASSRLQLSTKGTVR